MSYRLINRVAIGKPTSKRSARGLWTWLCFECGEGGSVANESICETRAKDHRCAGDLL
jgi:hypothetical protein